MDRLSMALELIREAQVEKENLKQYTEELDKLPGYGEPDHWEKWQELDRKFKRIPKKSVVNDNLKLARRLLLNEYI